MSKGALLQFDVRDLISIRELEGGFVRTSFLKTRLSLELRC